MRSLVLLLAAACTCQSPVVPGPVMDEVAEEPGTPPNVLVVIWDTVRADHTLPYGYARHTTPNLANFAAEGTVYTRAVSPGMWTLPSHASLFTGLPARTHGVEAHHKWLDHRFDTLAERFGREGYGTYLFSANPFVAESTNLTQGFDRVEHPWSKPWRKAARDNTLGKLIASDASNSLAPGWQPTLYPTGRANDRVKDAGPVAAEALFSWLDKQDGPWLGVVNYMEAHVPRVPSRAAREALFDAETIEDQLSLDQSFGYLLAYTVGKHHYTPRELDVIESTYDAALRDLDDAFGVLLEGLEARGMLDNTVVVVTSDHGEHLGEHHAIGHKYSVYNPLVRVPLIVRLPGRIEVGRVGAPVSTAALLPTLLDVALGRSDEALLPSLRDVRATPPQVCSELVSSTPQALQRVSDVHPDLDWRPWLRTFVSVETGTAKCIVASDGQRELYAMPEDALEEHDLAAVDLPRVEAVCGRMDACFSGHERYDPASAGPDDQPTKELDDEVKARLCQLGYVDDCEETP